VPAQIPDFSERAQNALSDGPATVGAGRMTLDLSAKTPASAWSLRLPDRGRPRQSSAAPGRHEERLDRNRPPVHDACERSHRTSSWSTRREVRRAVVCTVSPVYAGLRAHKQPAPRKQTTPAAYATYFGTVRRLFLEVRHCPAALLRAPQRYSRPVRHDSVRRRATPCPAASLRAPRHHSVPRGITPCPERIEKTDIPGQIRCIGELSLSGRAQSVSAGAPADPGPAYDPEA
jgi:hypothetical protein